MPPETRSQIARRAVAHTSLPPQQAVAAVQPRQWSKEHLTNDHSYVPPKAAAPNTIPRFEIDLSRPPEHRYLEVIDAFKKELSSLTALFDEVFGGVVSTLPFITMSWIHFACSWLLRRVCDDEENRELRGISAATNLSMYLLVCFNVLLDVFMGCSSGGARISDRDGKESSRVVHFRTLDWGMPALRKFIVQLDFKLEESGPIVASSITYVGYVGVLTGVRKDLSVSLNFRPQRNHKGRFWSDFLFYSHLLMVICGQRRSISSNLRRALLSRKEISSRIGPSWQSYEDVVDEFSKGRLTTTACYLCLCNGQETTIIEKDRISATKRSNKEIIVITNHDVHNEIESSPGRPTVDVEPDSHFLGALADIVHEAQDRRECAEQNYRALLRVRKGPKGTRLPSVDDIVALVQKYPTTNESTHFACVMDPTDGTVSWCRKWTRPVGAKWIREHMS